MMKRLNRNADDKLKESLLSYTAQNSDYWSFRGKAGREHAHDYLQYPAMMVPRMQGELIRILRESEPEIQNVYDPFVGSGTVMTEAMLQGLNFFGQDINPLAVLICRAKKGPLFSKSLNEKSNALLEAIHLDDSSHIEVDFPNLFKWFRVDIAIELSRIKRAIKKEPKKWARRFFWLAFSETIRLASNSRTSTFKLHIRPIEEVNDREIDAVQVFENTLASNLKKLVIISSILRENGFLKKGRFAGDVDIRLEDSGATNTVNNGKLYDLLVTSPPYGDNTSTVPYGQYSYLPLQWIDHADIDDKTNDNWTATTSEIDKRSLGGIKVNALEDGQELYEISKSFAQTMDYLRDKPKDRAIRVASFCRDLNNSLDPILSRLKDDALMIWTIGNRMVGGRKVPMDKILSEFLDNRGAKQVVRLKRFIPCKRMAVRNNIAKTMRAETILVMRKGTA